MTLNEITTQINESIKLGQFTKVHYLTKGSKDPNYRKETETVIRFVEYGHINGVVVKGQGNPNESHVIPNILIYNKNTGKYYLQMAIVPSETIVPNVKYYYQDQEIDKATFEAANPKRPSAKSPTIVFRKCIDDIISLGNEKDK